MEIRSKSSHALTAISLIMTHNEGINIIEDRQRVRNDLEKGEELVEELLEASKDPGGFSDYSRTANHVFDNTAQIEVLLESIKSFKKYMFSLPTSSGVNGRKNPFSTTGDYLSDIRSFATGEMRKKSNSCF